MDFLNTLIIKPKVYSDTFNEKRGYFHRGKIKKIISVLSTFLIIFSYFNFYVSPSVEAAFPGENGKLVITSGHSSYNGRTRSNILYNPDGTGFEDLSDEFGQNTQVLKFTADGTKIVDIYGYIDLKTRTFIPWPAVSAPVSTSLFSFTVCPDDRLYYMSEGPLNDGIYMYSMNFDGSDLKYIAEINADGLSCSPDGKKIAFISRDGASGAFGGDLFTIDTDGQNLKQITFGRKVHRDGARPSWSPDGKKIAYSFNYYLSGTSGPIDLDKIGIWVVDVDTKIETRIYSDGSAPPTRPLFSPDGKTIAFYKSSGEGAGKINFIDVDGTNFRTFVVIEEPPFPSGAYFATSWQSIPYPKANLSTKASAPVPPLCGDLKPNSSPQLFQIDTTDKSATLYFSPTHNTTDYYIQYGFNPDEYLFGTSFAQSSTNGAIEYTINDLTPNSIYYFTVRGGNGCMPGDWSNTLKAKTLPQNNSLHVKIFTAWEQMRDVVERWLSE